MPLPWEEYQKSAPRLPWQDFQTQGTAPTEAQPASEESDGPWYAKAGQAADDVARLIANGATFGYADKIAGYLDGNGTDQERALTQEARDRAGSAGQVAEVGGAIATPVGLAGRGVTLAGRLGTGALKGLPGLAARTGLMGAEGAGYGTLTAAGNDQDLATGAGIGALGGVGGNLLGEGLSAGVSKAAGAFNKAPKMPSIDELNTMKAAAYDRADQAGVAFTPSGVAKLRANIIKDFTDRGFLPANEPGAAAVLKEIDGLQGQNVTLKGLDSIRKMAGNAYVPGNKSNNTLTSSIIKHIDGLTLSPGASDVMMGDAQAGSKALSEARNLASRTIKAEKLNEAMGKADLRAASTGSGGNVDNATRQNARRLLEKPRGYTPDEKKALEAIVRGTPTQNALRLAGKLSPSGNGLMAALGVGGAMVNPLLGAASLGGMGAKAIADNITSRNVQELSRIIAAGGKASATKAAPNTVQRLAQAKRDSLARILMSIGVKEGVAP